MENQCDVAYRQGLKAGLSRFPVSTNPYMRPSGSINHGPYFEWYKGWVDGQKQLKENTK